uniref:Uncharacterized protein n=1 Tax=Ixodes ricinus TaxID=34613 RepID=A0A6B0UHF2_IXORI
MPSILLLLPLFAALLLGSLLGELLWGLRLLGKCSRVAARSSGTLVVIGGLANITVFHREGLDRRRALALVVPGRRGLAGCYSRVGGLAPRVPPLANIVVAGVGG